MEVSFAQKLLAHELTLARPAHDAQKLAHSLNSAQVDLNPHQIDAALFAFRSPLSRGAILADEVGLGKTIEAGLVIGQLYAEGKKKILLLLPASLRKQWQNELWEKFALQSLILDGTSYRELKKEQHANPFRAAAIIITSTQFAYSKKDEVKAAGPWDLIVFDEAHQLRNVYKKGNKVAKALREMAAGQPKLLLSATPLQNSLMELYGLTSFIDEKLLGTEYSFRAQFLADNRELAPVNLEELHRRIQQVCTRALRRQVKEYISYTNRLSMVEDFTPTDTEVDLYAKVSAYLQRPQVAAIEHSQRALMVLIYRKLSASSSFAIARTLGSLIANLERKVQGLSPELPVEFTTEVEGYEEESEELTAGEIPSEEDSKVSEEEASKTFTREEIEAEIVELKSYQALAESIQKNSKGEALLVALEKAFDHNRTMDQPEKAVIFTESRRTQQYLFRLLSHNGYDGQITLFSGSNEGEIGQRAYALWEKECKDKEPSSRLSREAALHEALIYEFKTRTKILIATEAGAEGLNLQFCNLVVNYDLPWNPQRVEQRIGRCHRYGQKYDVVVLNFVNRKNAADRRVYELLDQKFKLFQGVFGVSDEVLGVVGSGVDFERRILKIYQTCRAEEEIQAAFDKLQEELADQISATMVEAQEKLLAHFDDEVRTRLKVTEENIRTQLSWVDECLARLLTGYLGLEHVRPSESPYFFEVLSFPPALVLNLPPSLRPGLYCIGSALQSVEGDSVTRLSLGHPLITAVIDKVKEEHPDLLHHIELLYNEGRHKISLLEPYLGGEGLWFTYKFCFEGLEAEERLAHVVLGKEGSQFHPLSRDLAEKFVTITALEKSASQALSLSPEVRDLRDKELRSIEEKWSAEIGLRNEEYYDRELDKLETYSEEALFQLQDELKQVENEGKEAKRKRQRAGTFDERNAARREVHRLEQEFSRVADRIAREKKQLFQEKEQAMEELEKQLKLKVTKSLVATAVWRLL